MLLVSDLSVRRCLGVLLLQQDIDGGHFEKLACIVAISILALAWWQLARFVMFLQTLFVQSNRHGWMPISRVFAGCCHIGDQLGGVSWITGESACLDDRGIAGIVVALRDRMRIR